MKNLNPKPNNAPERATKAMEKNTKAAPNPHLKSDDTELPAETKPRKTGEPLGPISLAKNSRIAAVAKARELARQQQKQALSVVGQSNKKSLSPTDSGSVDGQIGVRKAAKDQDLDDSLKGSQGGGAGEGGEDDLPEEIVDQEEVEEMRQAELARQREVEEIRKKQELADRLAQQHRVRRKTVRKKKDTFWDTLFMCGSEADSHA